MSMLPKVSVVMSVYNGEKNLTGTLDSILTQEGCDFEFIVINDGSSDATAEILNSYAVHESRLRVFHQENSGLTRALIRGCLEARGEYIARQDAGDISLQGRLREQSMLLRRNDELCFVSCETRYETDRGEYLYRHSGSGIAKSPVKITDIGHPHGVLDGPSHHGSVMFRRDKYIAAGGYRPQFYFGQDWDLWYRLGENGKFQLLNQELYTARIGIADISSGNKNLQEQIAKLSLAAFKLRSSGKSDFEILQLVENIKPERQNISANERRSKGSYFLGECLRKNGDVENAKRYFLDSVKYDPLSIKSWLRLMQIRLKGK